MNHLHHVGNEVPIGNFYFISANMQVRQIVSIDKFCYNVFDNGYSFLTLHICAKSPCKCSAVARHIYFGHESYKAVAAILDQIFNVFFTIIFTLITNHIFCSGELRILLYSNAPRNIFRRMEMKNIQLIPRHYLNLLL